VCLRAGVGVVQCSSRRRVLHKRQGLPTNCGSGLLGQRVVWHTKSEVVKLMRRVCSWLSRQFMDALQEKKFQKHVAAEFIGTLLFTFLAGAGKRDVA
jgi:hypothetical protein